MVTLLYEKGTPQLTTRAILLGVTSTRFLIPAFYSCGIGVERDRECEIAGRAGLGSPRILDYYSSSVETLGTPPPHQDW